MSKPAKIVKRAKPGAKVSAKLGAMGGKPTISPSTKLPGPSTIMKSKGKALDAKKVKGGC